VCVCVYRNPEKRRPIRCNSCVGLRTLSTTTRYGICVVREIDHHGCVGFCFGAVRRAQTDTYGLSQKYRTLTLLAFLFVDGKRPELSDPKDWNAQHRDGSIHSFFGRESLSQPWSSPKSVEAFYTAPRELRLFARLEMPVERLPFRNDGGNKEERDGGCRKIV